MDYTASTIIKRDPLRIHARVDTTYHAIPIVTVLLMLIAGFWVPAKEMWLVWCPGLALLGILVWIIYGTWYELDETHLVCHSGPFSERIAYNAIRSITRCANFYSSMATAHQRLVIRQHDKSFVMGTTYISPPHQEEFLAKLTEKCPNLNRN